MRKTILLLPVLLAGMFFYSCQKETSNDSTNKEIVLKVNAWLDKNKPANKVTQSENVELLKSNLEFSNLRIEKSVEGERIIIIPVKKNFKTIKNIDKTSIPNLMLILDNMGNVRKGNLVLFYPQVGQTYSKVPDNTFYNILNTSKPECNGKFRYLSVTGKRLHELEYENGNLKSFGNFKDSSANSSSRTSSCVNWYWVTTYYNEDGEQINETWDYIGKTCQGEDCEDPYNAMLCPMDGSSGGSTGDDEAWEFLTYRIIKWYPYIQPSSTGGPNADWYIDAGTLLKGKKVAGAPYGGHFTSVERAWTMDCSGCSAYNVQFTWTGEYITGGQSGSHFATHQAVCSYSVNGAPPIGLNKHNYYDFAVVFP